MSEQREKELILKALKALYFKHLQDEINENATTTQRENEIKELSEMIRVRDNVRSFVCSPS